jgi:hypothetical protein
MDVDDPVISHPESLSALCDCESIHVIRV